MTATTAGAVGSNDTLVVLGVVVGEDVVVGAHTGAVGFRVGTVGTPITPGGGPGGPDGPGGGPEIGGIGCGPVRSGGATCGGAVIVGCSGADGKPMGGAIGGAGAGVGAGTGGEIGAGCPSGNCGRAGICGMAGSWGSVGVGNWPRMLEEAISGTSKPGMPSPWIRDMLFWANEN